MYGTFPIGLHVFGASAPAAIFETAPEAEQWVADQEPQPGREWLVRELQPHEVPAPPEITAAGIYGSYLADGHEPCPGCGRIMSRREAAEQGACNDCHPGGAAELGGEG